MTWRLGITLCYKKGTRGAGVWDTGREVRVGVGDVGGGGGWGGQDFQHATL